MWQGCQLILSKYSGKGKKSHIIQAPESLDYKIKMGDFTLPHDGFPASHAVCLLTDNYFIIHLLIALFIYLATILASLIPLTSAFRQPGC